MLSSIQKHPLAEFGIAAAAAVGAYELDHHFGARDNQNRRSNPTFHTSLPNGAQDTLGVIPGCQVNAERYFDSLISFTTETNLVVTDYPEHTFDVEQVCEGLANQLIFTRAERPSLLCTSMGGIIMRHFLNYCEDFDKTDKLGGFGTIVLDSSPFDGSDIKRPYKLLLAAAEITRGSKTLDKAKRFVMQSMDKSSMSAGAHLDTITAEGKFISSDHPTGPLPNIMDRVIYIASANDRVIDTDRAAQKYVKVVPYGKFDFVTDYGRPSTSHTAHMPDYRRELNLFKTSLKPAQQLAA